MTKKKRLGLAVSLPLHDKISNLAEYQGKTINATCIDMFWDYFKHNLVIPAATTTAPADDTAADSQEG